MYTDRQIDIQTSCYFFYKDCPNYESFKIISKGMAFEWVICAFKRICMCVLNGFIITWILHQIIMYSNKVKLAAG